jgi:hypothetical protein
MSSFWTLLSTDGGDAKIDGWRTKLGVGFKRVANNRFFLRCRVQTGFTQMQNFASALDIRTKNRFWLPEVDWPRLDRLMVEAVLKLVTLDTVVNAIIPIIHPK